MSQKLIPCLDPRIGRQPSWCPRCIAGCQGRWHPMDPAGRRTMPHRQEGRWPHRRPCNAVGHQQSLHPCPYTGSARALLLLSFFFALSLPTAAATGDPWFRAPPLPNLSVKLFPNVGSPFSLIYFENSLFILT
jgi:hypothetical protein